MLSVAGRAAVVRSAMAGAVFMAAVLTLVRQTPCWLHVPAPNNIHPRYTNHHGKNNNNNNNNNGNNNNNKDNDSSKSNSDSSNCQ